MAADLIVNQSPNLPNPNGLTTWKQAIMTVCLTSLVVIALTDFYKFLLSQYRNIGINGLVWFALLLCVVAPCTEELCKRYLMEIGRIDNEVPMRVVVTVGYTFQVVEALFFSSQEVTWYVRLLLPLHVLFSIVSTRYGLKFGIVTHGIWNTQRFLSVSAPSYFIPASYIVLALVIYEIRVSKRN